MDITSLMYVLFLMGGGTIYYCIPERFRWKWLILLSFIFVYASSTFGALVILLTSGVVYFAARKIEKSSEAKEKKRVLLMTMIVCFSVLIVLKYLVALPIFEKHTILLGGTQQSIWEFVRMYLFPVGISYYTLQIVSYLLDVYWERIPAEQDLMNHINSITRPSLNNKSPYDLLLQEGTEDDFALWDFLQMQHIPPDEVHLAPDLFSSQT